MSENYMSRYRVVTTARAPGRYIHTHVDNRGANETTGFDVALESTQVRSMFDEVVHGYRKRSKAGEIFNNPMSASTVRRASFGTFREDVYGDNLSANPADRYTFHDSAEYTSGTWPWLVHQICSFPEAVLPGYEEQDLNARVQVMANVNKTMFDAGTFAAEWSKTKNLHRDVGNALLKLMTGRAKNIKRKSRPKRVALFDSSGHALLDKHGKPTYTWSNSVDDSYTLGASQHSKNLADAYLTGRYGVAPLLGDLENAAKYLSKRRSVRQTARSTFSVRGRATSQLRFDGDGHHIFVDVVAERELVRRYGILYDSDLAMQKVAQLGLTRPLSTAWELVPYSFVADWFLGVGNWLDAVQPSGFTSNKSAWVSTKEEHREIILTITGVKDFVDTPNLQRNFTINGSAQKVTTLSSRNPWVPSVPTRPAFQEGFNAMRATDFAALVLQKIRIRF